MTFQMVMKLPVLKVDSSSWKPNPMRVRVVTVVAREETVVSLSQMPSFKRYPRAHAVQVDDEQVFQLEIWHVERERLGFRP